MTKPLSAHNIDHILSKLEQSADVAASNAPVRPDVAALITAASTLASLLRDITDLVMASSGQEHSEAADRKSIHLPSFSSEPSSEVTTEPTSLSAKEIEETLSHEYIVCLEDGRRVKSLKPYLRRFNLTPDQYRRKWKLPMDYPMVCRSLSEKRSALVRKTRPHLKRYPHIEEDKVSTVTK